MINIAFKNKYIINDDMTTIVIKQRNGNIHNVLIDTEDLEILKELDYSWHVAWDGKLKSYYVCTTLYKGMINGKPKYEPLLLHIVVMKSKPKKGEYVDHKNHDTLDNRKSNLKIVPQIKNTKNRKGANKNTTSGERNVSWSKRDNKWIVQLQINKRNTKFGEFEYNDLDKAIELARKKRKEIYGQEYI